MITIIMIKIIKIIIINILFLKIVKKSIFVRILSFCKTWEVNKVKELGNVVSIIKANKADTRNIDVLLCQVQHDHD